MRVLERLFGPEDAADEQALAAVEISPREEAALGREAVQAYLAALKDAKIRVLTRGRDVAYLYKLAETVRPLLTNAGGCPPLKIYLADTSWFEARSFPDGTLVFSRGLLETAESEAAVIGVMGHELSHLDRKHHSTRLRRMKLAQAKLQDARAGDLSAQFAAGTSLARLWTHPFRPEDEQQADLDGARWAYQAGYDPREFARLIEAAARQTPAIPVPGFLRSHPVSRERVAALAELYAQLQKQEPKDKLYVGRENLRRRVARGEQ
jgi:predicted Zn-dependent protease